MRKSEFTSTMVERTDHNAESRIRQLCSRETARAFNIVDKIKILDRLGSPTFLAVSDPLRPFSQCHLSPAWNKFTHHKKMQLLLSDHRDISTGIRVAAKPFVRSCVHTHHDKCPNAESTRHPV